MRDEFDFLNREYFRWVNLMNIACKTKVIIRKQKGY